MTIATSGASTRVRAGWKQRVKAYLARRGLDLHKGGLVRSSIPIDASRYECFAMHFRYAPWKLDAEFESIYEQIKHNTLVDKYRCYELWSLVEQSRKLSGSLIEVGVWRGGTSALIARRARLSGITDSFYACDTFRGVVKTSAADEHYVDGAHSDTSRGEAEGLFARLGLDNVRILEGIFPDETAGGVEPADARFRFCHIDVDIYQGAAGIMDWIWGRMVVGGVVVFDDYGFNTTVGVTRYVDETKDRDDRIYLYNLNGHAVFVKIK